MGIFGGSSSSSSSNSSSTDTAPTSDFTTPSAGDSFTSPSPSSSTPSALTDQSLSEVRYQLQQQANMANAQYLMSKVNEVCFERCVPTPGSALGGSEKSCLSACMEKYIEGWNAVNRAYVGRVQRDGRQLPVGGGL